MALFWFQPNINRHDTVIYSSHIPSCDCRTYKSCGYGKAILRIQVHLSLTSGDLLTRSVFLQNNLHS